MTIDEAILHAREVAEDERKTIEILEKINPNDSSYKNIPNHIKSAEEHEQLAEWLELLKWYEKVWKIYLVKVVCCLKIFTILNMTEVEQTLLMNASKRLKIQKISL